MVEGPGPLELSRESRSESLEAPRRVAQSVISY